MRARLLLAVVAACCALSCADLLREVDRARDPAAGSTPEDGLREALNVGTGRAVDLLAKPDGYLGNALVRIPVPDKLRTAEKALRAVGAGRVVDDFVTSMNRAAEAAAPLAKQVFLGAVREMTISDAWTILRGKDHEATDYLRAHAGVKLHDRFAPIVAAKLESVGATRDLGRLLDRTAELPLVRRPVLDLDEYVTGKALDGLFATVATEEEKIRKDPVARTTALLRKWFGGSGNGT